MRYRVDTQDIDKHLLDMGRLTMRLVSKTLYTILNNLIPNTVPIESLI